MASANAKPAQLARQAELSALYVWLKAAYGRQAWWPAEGRFEILVGAILVQNTAWSNVELAITALKQKHWLTPDALLGANPELLAETIRPTGYFRVKTARLRNFCQRFQTAGGFEGLDSYSTDDLREALLGINGIGPETADAMLLYAFDRPVFVIDAYTRRLLTRLGWLRDRPSYEALRAVFELTLTADVDVYAQYHALIVEHAKISCRAKPDCSECALQTHCEYAAK